MFLQAGRAPCARPACRRESELVEDADSGSDDERTAFEDASTIVSGSRPTTREARRGGA